MLQIVKMEYAGGRVYANYTSLGQGLPRVGRGCACEPASIRVRLRQNCHCDTCVMFKRIFFIGLLLSNDDRTIDDTTLLA